MPAVPSLGRVIAVARDPRCLFVHWRMPDSARAEACAAHGLEASAEVELWLRVVQSGTTVLVEREITGEPEGRAYLDVPQAAGRRVLVELALRTVADKRWLPLERTPDVEMPRERVGDAEGATTWLTVAGEADATPEASEELLRGGGDAELWEEVESLFDLPCPVPAPWSHEPHAAGEALTEQLLKRWPHLTWSRKDAPQPHWQAVLDAPPGEGDATRENGPATPSEVRVRFAGRRWLFRAHDGNAARVLMGPWQVAVGSRTEKEHSGNDDGFVPLAQWQVHLAWQSEQQQGAPQMEGIYRTIFGPHGSSMLEHAQLSSASSESGTAASLWRPEVTGAGRPQGEGVSFEASEAWSFAHLAAPAHPGHASEELFFGASEQMVVGSSEQLFAAGLGQSVEVAGASEQLFVAGSEQLFVAGSEQLFSEHAGVAFPASSEQMFASSHNWIGLVTGTENEQEARDQGVADDDAAPAATTTASTPASPGLPAQTAKPEAGASESAPPPSRVEPTAGEAGSTAASPTPDEAARRVLDTYGTPPASTHTHAAAAATTDQQAEHGTTATEPAKTEQPHDEEAQPQRESDSAAQPATTPAAAKAQSLRDLPPAEIATAAATVLFCLLAVFVSAVSVGWASAFALLGVAGLAVLLGAWPVRDGYARGLRLAALLSVSVAVPLVIVFGFLEFHVLLSILLVVIFASTLVALLARVVLTDSSGK